MKKLFCCVVVLALAATPFTATNAQGILGKIKQKVKDKAEQKEDEKIDKAVDKAADGVDNAGKKSGSNGSNNNVKQVSNIESGKDEMPSLKVYQNYDFVPGDKILFEDNFVGDQDGEFPSHWELEKGQGQLNKVKGEEALFLTEGNYARVKPRMKTDKYLTDPFTVEFDYYNKDRAYGIITFLGLIDPACSCESSADVQVGASEASFGGAVNFSKTYPSALADENFINKWHHVAIAVKNHQLKLYIDQNRIMVVPDTKSDFFSVGFGGIGDENQPLIFKNVRIASGGNMNMIGKKFTESKIVTHGINFDVDKAIIKPESMGTLNMIVGVLKDNPDLKFSIEGHTDNSGTAAHNLTLSQQRAEAVKAQLIAMGIDGSRLSTKGLGDTKPISDNTSLEGKANNRRVEFVKM